MKPSRATPEPTTPEPRILVARPDRIGDVILSTPVIAALREQYPNASITFLVRDFVAPLVREIPGVDRVFVYDPDGRHSGVTGFFRLMEELKAQRFQISIVLQSTRKLAAALFGVGVPNRIGPLSKIHSYLFYNRGSRQRRSLVEMHEADYNLQLLRKLGIRVGSHQIPSRVAISEEKRKAARDWLADKGWDARDENRKRLIAVHPGMGGSALNWPENYYVDLIRSLRKEGNEILLSGGPAEGFLLERIVLELAKTDDTAIVYAGKLAEDAGPASVDTLGALFAECDLVVAPSTGPLHVAVALGLPVVTFYPPIRVQSAIRWGPYLNDPEDAGVLVPEVYCGEDFKCRGPKCNYYPCMKMIGPREALREVSRLLGRRDAERASREKAASSEGTVPGGNAAV
ncbi:MAG: glycosyltransferase family 9 protein [Bdellovibrionales bacterium]|nr:glycosyltransferase family 9 protein [Bdellovibrionales bacterium]